MYIVIDRCRSCGCNDLKKVLDLGRTPLANATLDLSQLISAEERYPLSLVFCPECTLLQLEVTVSPNELFDEYLYFSSFSETFLEHSKRIADKLVSEYALNSDSLVVEMASNDGYLLQYYKEAGVPVLGIEPAGNVAKVAREERDIDTIGEYFSHELAEQLRVEEKKADIFHAHNVLAHVPDVNDIVAGIHTLLNKDGVAIIETPYLRDLIENCEFDTIYHEHLFYYSLTALDHLFTRHNLVIQDVERTAIHGGSLRLYVKHSDQASRNSSVVDMLEAEQHWGVSEIEVYQRFAEDVQHLKKSLVSTLTEIKNEQKRVAAYGASAKGSTLINYFGIGDEILDFVVDRNTHKQGRFTPGTHLPIFAPERLLVEQPHYVLLLTWNFAEEIIEQQSEYIKRGGRFIVPIPEVRVI